MPTLGDVLPYFSIIIAAIALGRNLRQDTKNDEGRISEILVKIEIMQSDLKEIKADFKTEIKGLRSDIETLKEKIIKVEASASSAHKRIDGLNDQKTT